MSNSNLIDVDALNGVTTSSPSDSTDVQNPKKTPNPLESQAAEAEFVSKGESESLKVVWADMERAKVVRYKDEHGTRIWLIENLFVLTCLWLIVAVIILVAVGNHSLELSDNVLITLITTTTIEVLGYLSLVLLYMFNKDGTPQTSKDLKIKNKK